MHKNYAILNTYENAKGNMMIKTIIFDMDGTILNTIDDIAIAVNVALKEKNLPSKSVDEVKLAVGNGAKKLIERITPIGSSEALKHEVFTIYQTYYNAHSQDFTGPYKGIIGLLSELKKQGYKLATVSNKYHHLVQELNKNVFQGLFDCTIGETHGIPIKPAPDMVYLALKEMDSTKEETLFIGDSDVDIDTARNAGMKSVGVTWGFRTKDVLLKHQATYIIDHPEELYVILKEENQHEHD